jgi:PmbA protein
MITERFNIKTTNYTISVQNGQIDSVRNKEFEKKSIRVFLDDGRLGIASAVGDIDDEKLLEKAQYNADLGFTYDYDLETDVHYECSKGDHDLVDISSLSVAVDDLLRDVKTMSPKFVISGKFYANREKLSLQNSENLLLNKDQSSYNGFLSLKRIGSPDIMDTYVGFDSFFKIDRNLFLNETELMMQAITMDVLNNQPDDLEVAFLKGELFSLLRGNINGESYNLGTSLLAGKLNSLIMRDDVNICEVFEDDNEAIFVPFDHEGIIRNHDVYIIKNGIFSQAIYDKKRAKKYNVRTTGNGFRNYESHPNIAALHLSPETTMTSLLQYSYDKTLLVPYISSGGDFLPNGDFSFPIQLAFYIKNGKIIGKTPQLTLTGNYLDMMRDNLVGIAKNDLFTFSAQINAVICRPQISRN